MACVIAVVAATGSHAHPETDGYLAGCLSIYKIPPALPDDPTSPPGVGLRNSCDQPVVATLCSKDVYGAWNRWDVPINLPAGANHSWTVHDPKSIRGMRAFSCSPGYGCEAGAASHDPHCH